MIENVLVILIVCSPLLLLAVPLFFWIVESRETKSKDGKIAEYRFIPKEINEKKDYILSLELCTKITELNKWLEDKGIIKPDEQIEYLSKYMGMRNPTPAFRSDIPLEEDCEEENKCSRTVNGVK